MLDKEFMRGVEQLDELVRGKGLGQERGMVLGQEHGREQELVRGKERELEHGKEQVDDVACEPKPCLDRFHLYI